MRRGSGCRTTGERTWKQTWHIDKGRSVLLYKAAVTKQSQNRRSSPSPSRRVATQRFAFESVGGEGRGGQSPAPFPIPSSSQRFGTLERISLPSALDLPRLPEKTPPPSAKDKSTTERWSFGGGKGGGSGEEKADGNSLLINGNEWVRGEIRRDREWGVCSAASLERQAFTHCTRCTGQSYRSR